MLTIILSIIFGLIIGYFIGPMSFTASGIEILLCALLFLVGLDLGRSDDLLRIFRRMGKETIFIPLYNNRVYFGGVVAGFVFGYNFFEGAALGSGMGWYSLSGVIIEKYNQELAVIAFLSNIFREVLGIAIVPIAAKKISYLSSIPIAGAGAMDTVLPIISKNTDNKTTIIAFFTGAILSASIPILVQFFIGFAY